MLSNRRNLSQAKRIIAYVIIAVVILLLVADFVVDIRDFLGDHRGIDFYRRNPLLIGLVAILAIGTGFVIKRMVEYTEGTIDRKGRKGKEKER